MRTTGATLISIAGAALSISMPAYAHDQGLARCLAVPDKDARLACYDAIARAEQSVPAPSRPAPVVPAAPAAPAAPAVAAGPAANPRQEFGFGAAEREARRAPEQRQLDEVVMRVTEAREVGAGYWQFVMDDGSVWRLDEKRASFRAPRPNDQVKLLRASLGSYLLVYRNQGSLRIKRIK